MATRVKRALSARLVAREVSELSVARWQRWKALVPQERLSPFVFDVVLSASLAHHPLHGPLSGEWVGIEAARVLGRPVTATAIARSMQLPATTVRRQAADLADAGLLERGAKGFRVAGCWFADGRVASVAAADAAGLMHSLQALAKADYAPAAAAIDAGAADLPAGVVARLTIDFSLRTAETFVQLYGDVTTGAIMTVIIAANVRHITQDPQLAQEYAGEQAPPPDSLRRPVAIRAVARELGAPFETVRRRVANLIQQERVQWRGDGVIVPTSALVSPVYFTYNRRVIEYFEQMLATLASLAADMRY